MSIVENKEEILKRFFEKVDPAKLVEENVSRKGDVLSIAGEKFDLRKFRKVYLLAYGKSAYRMAVGLYPYISDKLADSFVIVDRRSGAKDSRFRIFWGNHPIPDEEVYTATREIIKKVRYSRKSFLMFNLISGGGSALLEYPFANLKPIDLERMWRILLDLGLNIHEINTVRRHLSAVKGGRLARLLYPSRVMSLVISDVVGDPLHDIASGPTAPDPTTYKDAWNILLKYDVNRKWKASRLIKRGMQGALEDTLKPGDPVFQRVTNKIIANIPLAARMFAETLEEFGMKTEIVDTQVEARPEEAADRIFRELMDRLEPGKAYIYAGELYGPAGKTGIGGTAHELALQLYLRFRDADVEIIAFDTDGLDGNSPAAGGILRTDEVSVGVRDILAAIESKDTYTLMQQAGLSLHTGYTGVKMGQIWALYKPG